MPNKGPSDIAIRYDRKAIAADLSAEQLEEIFRELDNYFAQKQPQNRHYIYKTMKTSKEQFKTIQVHETPVTVGPFGCDDNQPQRHEHTP